MAVLIAKIGNDPRDELQQLGDSYLKRAQFRPKIVLSALREEKRSTSRNDQKIREKEGSSLLKASEGYYRICLDEKGAQLSSKAFAKKLTSLLNYGKNPAFLLGGPTGLGANVLQSANELLSLSLMTLPHRLAYCFLAEQLYRAGEILRNSPYHK